MNWILVDHAGRPPLAPIAEGPASELQEEGDQGQEDWAVASDERGIQNLPRRGLQSPGRRPTPGLASAGSE